MFDLVIKNGSVVFPGEGVKAVDVGVRDGKIAGFVDRQAVPQAKEVVDATDRYVFPGGIDPHVHLGIYNHYLEDFELDTRAAALGGYTCIVNYYRHADSYLGTVATMIEQAERVSTVDFAFSLGLLRQVHWTEFRDVVRETGITSWKSHRQYEREVGTRFKVSDPLMLDDDDLLDTMRRFAELSDRLLVCVHCEDTDIARAATSRLKRRHGLRHTLAEFADTSPGYAEAVSLLSAMYFAYVVGSRNLYVVHLSSGHSVDLLQRAPWLQRETGTVIETTPHYLTLTKHSSANLWAKVGPPIQGEWDRQRLWQAIDGGQITSYGGDHIPCRPPDKKGGQDLWNTKFGFGGIGLMMPLLLDEGYHKRHLPLEHLAYLMSTAPAKSFALYPQKGAMAIGSDADLVLVDLAQERTVTSDMPQVPDGYTVYEGIKLKGWPVRTILRGRTVASDHKILAEPGCGRYIFRKL